MKKLPIFLLLVGLLFSFQSWGQCTSGDCKNGKGVYEFANGAKYQGEFWDGQRHGFGTFYYPNGDKYAGNWANRFPEGQGTMFYADGRKEQGYWEKGKYLGADLLEETAIAAKPQEEKPDLAAKGVEEDEAPKPTFAAVEKITEKIDPSSVADIKMWAVVVGVSNYESMPRLNYTDDDAYQVYAFLKSPQGGALPDEQIKILIDESATRDRIEATMREVYGKADENDVIVLYFSGHGLKGAFLPIDYNGKANKLEHDQIREILDESPAKYKLCIADACHSGSLTRTRSLRSVDMTIKTFYDAFKMAEGGMALMMSSKSDEISLESNGLRQGIFSHFLIRGLKGEADANGDKIVTVDELYTYVSNNVTDFTGAYQTPMISGDYDNNMPVGSVR